MLSSLRLYWRIWTCQYWLEEPATDPSPFPSPVLDNEASHIPTERVCVLGGQNGGAGQGEEEPRLDRSTSDMGDTCEVCARMMMVRERVE